MFTTIATTIATTVRTIGKTLRRAGMIWLLAASGLVLAACTANPPLTSSSPNVFYARLTQDGLTGQYDPAGYSTADVQRVIGQICANKRITRYSEQPVNGKMAFSGYCWGGSEILFGTMTFIRMGNRVRIEVPGFAERWRKAERVWSISL